LNQSIKEPSLHPMEKSM